MVDIQLTRSEIQDVEHEQFLTINKNRANRGKPAAINMSEFTVGEFDNYEELVTYHLEQKESNKISYYKPIYDKAFRTVARRHKSSRGFTAQGVHDFSADDKRLYEELVEKAILRTPKRY